MAKNQKIIGIIVIIVFALVFFQKPAPPEVPENGNGPPGIVVVSPLEASTVSTSDVLVQFKTTGWKVGGKGERHVAINVNYHPYLSYEDTLLFYNGNDNVVEINTGWGGTPHATWVNETSFTLNNLKDGAYMLKVSLANPDDTLVMGKNASMSFPFMVKK